MALQKKSKISCTEAEKLPHNLFGTLILGEVDPAVTPEAVAVYSSQIDSSFYFMNLSQVNPGTDDRWQVEILEEEKEIFDMFEPCCLKLTIEANGCSVPFTVNGLQVECVTLCLTHNCEAVSPYELVICTEEATIKLCDSC